MSIGQLNSGYGKNSQEHFHSRKKQKKELPDIKFNLKNLISNKERLTGERQLPPPNETLH